MVKRKLCYVNTKLRETEVKNNEILFFFLSLNVISQLKSTQIRVQLLNILGFFFWKFIGIGADGKEFPH